MLQEKFVMNCPQGFHLRPAQVLMEETVGLDSKILLKKENSDTEADAKSILSLMSMGLEHGETVAVTTTGPDEKKAMETVRKLFATNFGEQDAQ